MSIRGLRKSFSLKFVMKHILLNWFVLFREALHWSWFCLRFFSRFILVTPPPLRSIVLQNLSVKKCLTVERIFFERSFPSIGVFLQSFVSTTLETKTKDFFEIIGVCIFLKGDFSWRDGCTLPKNSYKPSQDRWEAIL